MMSLYLKFPEDTTCPEVIKSPCYVHIYTGATSKQLKLVDGSGDLYDAPDKAAEPGGIKGELKVLFMNRTSPSRLLLSLTFLFFLGFPPAYFVKEQDIIKHQ